MKVLLNILPTCAFALVAILAIVQCKYPQARIQPYGTDRFGKCIRAELADHYPGGCSVDGDWNSCKVLIDNDSSGLSKTQQNAFGDPGCAQRLRMSYNANR